MKKALFTLITIFITTLGFSQSSSLNKLLSAKKGDVVFQRLSNNIPDNIEETKRVQFKTQIENSASKIKSEAIEFFTNKYSKEDINEIYNEFTNPKIINYSQKTLIFLKEWRGFKNKFQKEFKDTYKSFI